MRRDVRADLHEPAERLRAGAVTEDAVENETEVASWKALVACYRHPPRGQSDVAAHQHARTLVPKDLASLQQGQANCCGGISVE